MAVARGDRINGDFEYLINGSARFIGLRVFIPVFFSCDYTPFVLFSALLSRYFHGKLMKFTYNSSTLDMSDKWALFVTHL